MLSINRSLTATGRYISIMDQAIDREAPGFDFMKFAETEDQQYIPLKGSEVPTVFHYKTLSMRRMQRIMSMRSDEVGSPEQSFEALAYGLKKVEGMEVDGKPLELKFETVGGEERVADKSLQAMYKFTLFRELGQHIIKRSDLSF